MSVEVKVGILFCLIAILAVVVGLFLTQASGRLGTYHVWVHFKDTNGLATGADVLLDGVSVGKVASVELVPSHNFPSQPVAVKLAMHKNTPLFATDGFVIDQSSLLGDRFVSVKRPSDEELTTAGKQQGMQLTEGAELAGGSLVGLSNLSDQVQTMLQGMQAAITAVTNTYASPEMKAQLVQLMGRVNQAGDQLQVISASAVTLINALNHLIAVNQGAVTHAVSNIEMATTSMKSAMAQVDRTLHTIGTGPIPANLVITVANIRKTSDVILASAESIHAMVSNPDNEHKLEGALQAVAKTTANLAEISEHFKKLSADPQLEGDITATLDNLKATSANIREITETTKQVLLSKQNLLEMNDTLANINDISKQAVTLSHNAGGALQRADKTIRQVSHVFGEFTPEETPAFARVEAERGGTLHADVNLDLRWGPDPYAFWRVGVRDLGGKSTLDLQRSLRVANKLSARAGIFANSPGLGVDYEWSPGNTAELEDWYHSGNNHLDLRTYWALRDQWLITAGLYNFMETNDPFIGIQHNVWGNSNKK